MLHRPLESCQAKWEASMRRRLPAELPRTSLSGPVWPGLGTLGTRSEILLRRRTLLVLGAAAVLGGDPTLILAQGGTPASQHSNDLLKGVTFEPITNGSAEELLAVADLVSATRIAAEVGPGVLSFYNDNAGFVGPRILVVESGPLTAGPINVSPGSLPGPSLLVQASGGQDDEPAVVLPGSNLLLEPGDLIFFPADTAYRASTFEAGAPAIYLELAVFPVRAILRQAGDVVVSGYVAEPLAPDIGVAAVYPLAPPILRVGRLTLAPGVIMPGYRTEGRVEVFQVEVGAVSITAPGTKIQFRRGEESSPGQIIAPSAETSFDPSDAFMLPPGTEATVSNVNSQVATLLSVVIDPSGHTRTPADS